MTRKAPDIDPKHMASRVHKRVASGAVSEKPSKKQKTTAASTTAGSSRTTLATRVRKETSSRDDAINSVPATNLQVFVCGEGSSGELGLGPKNATEVKAPRPNPKLGGVIGIATGGMHGAALTADNEILTWGINDHETLARDTAWDGGVKDMDTGSDSDSDDDGDLNPRESTPTAVKAALFPSGTRFTQVAAGDSSTFVLTDEGLVYGWGTFRDANGIYGFTINQKTNRIVSVQKEPLLIPNLPPIKQLSVGADYVLALSTAGQIYAWGCGQQSELGHRILERRRSLALLPNLVALPKKNIKIASVHAGTNHAFAIDTNGQSWAWGSNNYGQTAIGTRAGAGEAVVPTPQPIKALAGIKMKSLAGGIHHSLGLTQAGETLVWGRIDGGQSGLQISELPFLKDPSKVVFDDYGKPRILLQPTRVPIGKCVQVVAGSDHCLAVTEAGKAYSWGFNATYQCGQGNDDDVLIAKAMEGKNVRDRKIVWAGAGGQYSMLGAADDK